MASVELKPCKDPECLEKHKISGNVRDFEYIKGCLPKDLPAKYIPYLKKYFDAQVFIAEKNLTEATEIFNKHLNEKIFTDFELSNPQLLAAIDLLVRGDSVHMTNDGVSPEFSFRKVVDYGIDAEDYRY